MKDERQAVIQEMTEMEIEEHKEMYNTIMDISQKFADSMDQLMTEQHTISSISDGSDTLDVKLDDIDETDLYFANHKED